MGFSFTTNPIMAKRADDVVAAYPLFQEEGGGSIPTSALSLRLEEISMRFARELNAQWHSMLPRTDLGNLLCGNTSVAYGAIYDGRYYAVGIWTQPIIRAMARRREDDRAATVGNLQYGTTVHSLQNAGGNGATCQAKMAPPGESDQLSCDRCSQRDDLQGGQLDSGWQSS